MATQASLVERFFAVVPTKAPEATPSATGVLDIRSRRRGADCKATRTSAGPVERLARTQRPASTQAWPQSKQSAGRPVPTLEIPGVDAAAGRIHRERTNTLDYHERVNTPLGTGLVAQVSRRIGMELQFGDRVEVLAERRWCPALITGFHGPCDGASYLDPDASGVSIRYAPENVGFSGEVCRCALG
jgi:hypothetical protein